MIEMIMTISKDGVATHPPQSLCHENVNIPCQLDVTCSCNRMEISARYCHVKSKNRMEIVFSHAKQKNSMLLTKTPTCQMNK